MFIQEAAAAESEAASGPAALYIATHTVTLAWGTAEGALARSEGSGSRESEKWGVSLDSFLFDGGRWELFLGFSCCSPICFFLEKRIRVYAGRKDLL